MEDQKLSNGVSRHREDRPWVPNPQSNLRVPNVHEALPFSPFTSIVPFSPDFITPPTITPRPSPTYFANWPGIADVHETLNQLAVGAASAETASKRCQQTLNDVLRLLEPQERPSFKFKHPPRPNAGVRPPQNAGTQPQLSRFADMVLKSVDVPYRYLTPQSPEPQPAPQTNGGHPQRTTPAIPQTQLQVEDGPLEYLPLTGSQLARLEAVSVPRTLTPAQQVEFQDMPRGDDHTRVMHTAGETSDTRSRNLQSSHNLEQKQKGDHAVQSLELLLSEIFTAQNQLQPEASDVAVNSAHGFFALREIDGLERILLVPEMQAKLDSHIHKVIAIGRLEQVSVDSLVRVQQLCEVVVAAVENLSLRVDVGWSDRDIDNWLLRMSLAEGGLIAARTLLRVMAAGSDIKELQSEEYLRMALAALTTVCDNCIIPTVEARRPSAAGVRASKEDLEGDSTFVIAEAHSKRLQRLLGTATKTLRVLGGFLIQSDLDETSLSSVESLCNKLLFAENATSERDSVFGLTNFEAIRQCAMDVVANDFAQCPEQRQSILDNILLTIDKLPATKQSARQYRLPNAKPIQLVSALLMRLVQTSATFGGKAEHGRGKLELQDASQGIDEEDGSDVEINDEDGEVIRVSRKAGSRNIATDLPALVKPLHDAAQSNASFIVNVLLKRALQTTKSSDEPYRKLLDIFTEDFLNVLGSSDWPASEMLVRTLVLRMIRIVEDSKATVPARTLALELLGTVATALLDLQIAARAAVRSVEGEENDLGPLLAKFVQRLDTGEIDVTPLVAFDGPYRIVLEYLQARDLQGPQLRSAQGYHVMQWAFLTCGEREGSADPDSGTPSPLKELQGNLRRLIVDLQWLQTQPEISTPSDSQGRLAAMVVTLSSTLCKAFNRIFSTILSAMTSEQSKVKSRALKSVVTLLEKDPSILDRNVNVLSQIFRCANDSSPLVRDSALMLISDCIKLRPHLNKAVYERVIARSRDTSTSVRKRAMKLLKDLYLGTTSSAMRAAIADALVGRMEDNDESVIDLARATVEEIWFVPFHQVKLDGDASADARHRYSAQASLLIRTTEASEVSFTMLESLVRDLTTNSKLAQAHTNVCRNLIRILSDGVIDTNDIAGSPDQQSILRCLTVFAKVCPKLFRASQIERLEPYTKNLSNTDDLDIYRSTVTILRHVLPFQASVNHEFLSNLQTSLLTSVSKLPKGELFEVVPCLWTINGMLGNIDRLVNFVLSVLKNVHNLQATDFTANPALVTKATKLIAIGGHLGRSCDFEEQEDIFRKHFPWYKGGSVAGLLIEIFCPFTSPKQLPAIRQNALEAVCMVCQSRPKLFLRDDVVTAIQLVFHEEDRNLEKALLDGLDSFFSTNDTTNATTNDVVLGLGITSGQERLGKTYVGTDQDGAATTIARRFLKPIVRIALSSSDELSLAAARIIISINRQGLAHPKDSGPALVALETCPNKSVSSMAYVEHKALHAKHESLLDGEYIHAVQLAFQYQRDVVGEVTGHAGQPPVAKLQLFWDVLKGARAQVRKRFLKNLAEKLNVRIDSADGTQSGSDISFVRFCVENLALFDYDKMDELLQTLDTMDRVWCTTGAGVAQAIESELLQVQVVSGAFPGISDSVTPGMTGLVPQRSPERLHQLAVAAGICSLIHETHALLRKLWNVDKYKAKSKKQKENEGQRAFARSSNAASLTETYLERIRKVYDAAQSPLDQLAVCSQFVELMAVDNEVRVASDDEKIEDEDEIEAEETPSESGMGHSPSAMESGGLHGRKRKSSSVNTTPRKRGRPSMEGNKRDELWD